MSPGNPESSSASRMVMLFSPLDRLTTNGPWSPAVVVRLLQGVPSFLFRPCRGQYISAARLPRRFRLGTGLRSARVGTGPRCEQPFTVTRVGLWPPSTSVFPQPVAPPHDRHRSTCTLNRPSRRCTIVGVPTPLGPRTPVAVPAHGHSRARAIKCRGRGGVSVATRSCFRVPRTGTCRNPPVHSAADVPGSACPLSRLGAGAAHAGSA